MSVIHWRRGLPYLATMIAASYVLRWLDVTGLLPTVLVGVAISLLFWIRIKPKGDLPPG